MAHYCMTRSDRVSPARLWLMPPCLHHSLLWLRRLASTKCTFHSDIWVNSRLHGDDTRTRHQQVVKEDQSGWVRQAVISRASFCRIPRNGKTYLTMMSLHINNQYAKKRGIAWKLVCLQSVPSMHQAGWQGGWWLLLVPHGDVDQVTNSCTTAQWRRRFVKHEFANSTCPCSLVWTMWSSRRMVRCVRFHQATWFSWNWVAYSHARCVRNSLCNSWNQTYRPELSPRSMDSTLACQRTVGWWRIWRCAISAANHQEKKQSVRPQVEPRGHPRKKTKWPSAKEIWLFTNGARCHAPTKTFGEWIHERGKLVRRSCAGVRGSLFSPCVCLVWSRALIRSLRTAIGLPSPKRVSYTARSLTQRRSRGPTTWKDMLENAWSGVVN